MGPGKGIGARTVLGRSYIGADAKNKSIRPPARRETRRRSFSRMMKGIVAVASIAHVAGFAAPSAAPATTALNGMSKSLPFLSAPKGLTGLVGAEAEFDPVGFAEMYDVKWMREAEIKHGRVSMLAIIGYTYPEMPWAQQAFPGDAYSHGNPIKAALAVPPNAFLQIVVFCGLIEFATNNGGENMTMMSMFKDAKRAPGDLGWDPMGLMDSSNEDKMKMRELQHCRLAMIAIGGMIHGSFVTGTGVFGATN